MVEIIFEAAGKLVLPAWLALALTPWLRQRARTAVWAATGWVLPLGLALTYLALVSAAVPVPGGGYGSLNQVRALWAHPGMLTAGWLHFLAFDLFVGTWMAREAARLGWSGLALLPCLALTFWLGPVGLLACFALKAVPGLRRAIGLLVLRQRPLAIFGLVMLLALLPAALAAWFDPRTLGGVDVWAKPMKFLASIGLYALTLAWLVGELPARQRASRLMRCTVSVVLAAGAFEAAYITLQGALGQASHFNTSTPFHTAMFVLMGIAALAFTATSLPVAHQLWRHGEGMAPAYRWGAVLGLLFTFVAGAGAGMIISAHGGPLVGTEVGPGLPVLGWSTTAGDYRVAHFLGVHAQQALPVAGALLARAMPRRALPALGLFALVYAGLVAAAYAQASSGIPLSARLY